MENKSTATYCHFNDSEFDKDFDLNLDISQLPFTDGEFENNLLRSVDTLLAYGYMFRDLCFDLCKKVFPIQEGQNVEDYKEYITQQFEEMVNEYLVKNKKNMGGN